MNGRYLIPANASRGKLLFGYFRPLDLGIFLTGIGISFILLLIFQNEMNNTWLAIGCLIPAFICIFLVIPIPYQHNVLVFFQEMHRFYSSNQKFRWKGWCSYNGEENK
jgi:hypothetical protein